MPLRWLTRMLGVLLAVLAVASAGWQVQVHGAGTTRGCGSAIDVLAGRTGWRQWWAADLTDATTPTGPLVRTEQCPGAENRRLVTVAVLLIAAVAVVVGGELTSVRSKPARARRRLHSPADRLGDLGRLLILAGAVLLTVGLVGLGLLLANPDATLFLYVSRPVVALLGAVALLPAVGLVAAGRALHLLGRTLAPGGSHDSP